MWKKLVVLLIGIGTVGCGDLEPDAGEALSPAVTNIQNYLKATWRQGQAKQPIVSASTHVCWLGRVQGNFEGGGEQVRLFIENGVWTLTGKSGQLAVGADAYCTRKDRFTISGPGTILGPFERKNECGFLVPGCVTDIGVATSGLGNTALMLTGVQGKYVGGGEYVWIKQPVQGATELHARRGDGSDYVRGEAHAFFPGWSNPVKFAGPGGQGLDATAAGEFIAPGTGMLDLGDASTRICYLTRFGGDLHDTFFEERADVFLDASNPAAGVRWRFDRTSVVTARARCMMFSQPL
jgi:hypothetical protein